MTREGGTDIPGSRKSLGKYPVVAGDGQGRHSHTGQQFQGYGAKRDLSPVTQPGTWSLQICMAATGRGWGC